MITNFILIMVVLKLASSVPQHDVLPQYRLPAHLLNPIIGISHPPTTVNFPASAEIGLNRPTVNRQSYCSLGCLPCSGSGFGQTPVEYSCGAPGCCRYINQPSQPAVNVISTTTTTTTTTATPGCTFGDKSYTDGEELEASCIAMKCRNGIWRYTGNYNAIHGCGKCLAHGDPHMTPYESPKLDYSTIQTGDFALTQPGFKDKTPLGVNINFEVCRGTTKSSIHSITYNQPGLTVTMTLPPPNKNRDFCSLSSENANSKECAITIQVNNKDRTNPYGHDADPVPESDGSVLVFKHDHFGGAPNLYCIAIVGSEGFSMALCQHYLDWPWFYVYAMPSLKHNPSVLQGLCDVWIGEQPNLYTMRNRTLTRDTNDFVNSWRVPSPNQ